MDVGLKLSLDFSVIPKAASWLNVAGMVCSVSMLITFLVLPVSRTSRHYLTVGLVVAVCLLQVITRGLILREPTPLADIHSWVLSFPSQQSRSNATMQ